MFLLFFNLKITNKKKHASKSNYTCTYFIIYYCCFGLFYSLTKNKIWICKTLIVLYYLSISKLKDDDDFVEMLFILFKKIQYEICLSINTRYFIYGFK